MEVWTARSNSGGPRPRKRYSPNAAPGLRSRTCKAVKLGVPINVPLKPYVTVAAVTTSWQRPAEWRLAFKSERLLSARRSDTPRQRKPPFGAEVDVTRSKLQPGSSAGGSLRQMGRFLGIDTPSIYKKRRDVEPLLFAPRPAGFGRRLLLVGFQQLQLCPRFPFSDTSKRNQ